MGSAGAFDVKLSAVLGVDATTERVVPMYHLSLAPHVAGCKYCVTLWLQPYSFACMNLTND